MTATTQPTSAHPLGRSSDFLARISETDRAALLALSARKDLRKGELIYKAGDPSTHVYFLETGRAKIFYLNPTGKEVVLWMCMPGELFGVTEIFQAHKRQTAAQIAEHAQLLMVTREAFLGFIQERPHLAMGVMELLANRMRDLGNMVKELVANDVTGRVVNLIARLGARYGRRQGDEVVLDMNITHQEIADMIGTSRQTVTTTLNMLKRQGTLNFRGRRICIAQQDLLEREKTGESQG